MHIKKYQAEEKVELIKKTRKKNPVKTKGMRFFVKLEQCTGLYEYACAASLPKHSPRRTAQ